MELPRDPMLLLSVLNMKLRDFYSSLDALAEDIGVDSAELLCSMHQIGYSYDAAQNAFVPEAASDEQ